MLCLQVMSQEIQEQLHKQQEVIADKQMSVKEDLDKVEPAVIEAQKGACSPRGPRVGEGGGQQGPPQVPVLYVPESISEKSQKPSLNTSDCPHL